MMGGPLRLKKDAVPRFFDCQPDRPAAATHDLRSAFVKINNKRQVTEMLTLNENISLNMKKKKILNKNEEISSKNIMKINEDSNVSINKTPHCQSTSNTLMNSIVLSTKNCPEIEIIDYSSEKENSHNNDNLNTQILKSFPFKPKVHFRSKKISCNIKTPVKNISCSPIKIKNTTNVATST